MSTRTRRGTARQSRKPVDPDDSDMSPPPRTRAATGARRAPKRSRDDSDADSSPPRRRGKAPSKASGAKGSKSKSSGNSSRRTARSRTRRRSDEDSGSDEESDDEPVMPPYPKRISRTALASCGELGPIAGLRDLAEKAAGGDATAIRRACVGTEFEFVAEVAARTAQYFTEGVGEFLAGAEEQLNQLSPGGKTIVNPRNDENRGNLARLTAHLSKLNAEAGEWEGLASTFTGKAALDAAAAAAELDDGAVDGDVLARFSAAKAAPDLMAELADRATIAAGAVAAAGKGAHASAADARALVGVAGATVHDRAFKSMVKGGAGQAAALLRAMAATGEAAAAAPAPAGASGAAAPTSAGAGAAGAGGVASLLVKNRGGRSGGPVA
ncbi:hypothetical protein FNF29_00479 [Cafeteria roenbergensis]|uniref:Uncharacterized protein n=1 Tax=Cafeteria roenbergensis TaxID=33653 RepID=A0A5A8DU30_CAFRO|nr:hypothetical protein FNF28_07301 [Cafeteria roenbergensis]KAA0157127.1 hypothetical protein FNF29_00479 [Cafeteria roenbergensis]KAA0168965.1 hypothetical protein FNF31_00126 [Cafeteria roenbergensis]|eukprot:KAA0157127.1 hypothetical protein FNF29_00479 [Cafeteria roenbergensis]